MAPTKRTRMADLAHLAGVSTATVSRVLSGKPGVKEDTRRTVLDAMSQLGYERESGAGKRGSVVAIVVPELSNPAFPAFVEELDILLFAAGQPNVVCPAGTSGTGEMQHLETLQNLNVTGVISVSGTPADSLGSNEHYRRLIESGIPAVFINGYAPDLRGAFFSCSDAEAVSASVTHLRSLGHERIGLAMGSERYLPARRKVDAFLALGFTRADIASTIFTAEGGQLAAGRLIDSGHTALVCGSDIMALGAIREATSRGLSIPDDLSVVGFDDSPLMAFTAPALTTIRQPVRAMCEAAVGALLDGLAGATLDRSELLFHPDLIIRNSTGPLQ
ncbi:LacI family transcriptional regulator [Tessaracoccus sp. OS52]|uniref:LacI family DNA-binding transcriptional regulator n=1 Tax=Tessaracoccus sp. OS52 TaxID=2886691 RepID=UPI001D115867|nr:LacI family DNA-binding transcriptional regulator [Tessaracoccus sp. OS52]MCC2592100.1 LacI family transcriptional regulator [Tessaracoccus sp. OS52]